MNETYRHKGKVYRRIDKREARKQWRNGVTIGLVACNMRPFGGWSYPCFVTPEEWIAKRKDSRNHNDYWMKPYLYPGLDVVDAAFQCMLDNWSYYNASYETGYYPHYYIEVS